jgi:Ca2+-binding RTX toxin-like protein
MPLGFITGETQVNTTATGDQRSAATTALANGGYVTVWASDNGDGSGKAIMGQRFAADGSKVGAEFLVNTTTAGDQDLPDVIAYSDSSSPGGVPNSFIVVWQSAEGGGSVIRGRRYLENGTAAIFNPHDQTNQTTSDVVVSGAFGGTKPSMGLYGTGRLAIVWEAPSGDGDGSAIVLAQYRSGLQAPGVVNTVTAGNQINPRIADSSPTGATIVWESQESGGDSIRARIISQAGYFGGEKTVNEASGEDESLPNVAEAGTLVIWNSGTNIMARDVDLANALTTPTGSAFVLNTTPGGVISRSDILGLGNGNYLAAYFTQSGDDGSSYSIRAEYFNRSGGAQSTEFLVPQSFAGAQEAPTITKLANGTIVITWASEADSLGNFEIKQRILSFDAPVGSPDDDTINGTFTDDVLNGLGGNDTINGLGGNDLIDGGDGNDTMDGGDGNDTATYVSATGAVTVSLATAAVQSTGGSGMDSLVNFENLTGSAFADTLTGDGGANVIEGGAGDDTLDGGGSAADTASYASATGSVTVSLATAAVQDTVGAGLDSLVNFENLTGSAFADTLTGDGAANVLDGRAGNDLLFAGVGEDTLIGGDGDDLLYYGPAWSAGDVANGGAGRDAVILQGNVTAVLGETSLAAIESISLQTGANTTYGDTANNRYDYNLTTADGNVAPGLQLIVNGQSLLVGEDFTLDGSAETSGKFLVYGGHGVEDLTGGDGTDIFFFEGQRWGAGDKVDGGDGRDSLVISAGSGITHIEFAADALTSIESISLNKKFATDPSQKPSYELVLDNGNVAAGATLIVNGASLADPTQFVSVDGSAVHDGNLRIFGGAGNDTLIGGDGADTLIGGALLDTLTGGAGADSFRYDATSESVGATADLILDFQTGTDKIDLTRIDARTTAGGNQAFTWIGSNAFSGVAGELRLFQDNGQWRVEGDTDGDTTADFAILFQTGTTAPVQSDFLL